MVPVFYYSCAMAPLPQKDSNYGCHGSSASILIDSQFGDKQDVTEQVSCDDTLCHNRPVKAFDLVSQHLPPWTNSPGQSLMSFNA